MIEIYKGYTFDDVIDNKPYIEGNLKIYPVKIKDSKKFNQYINYFSLSKKHYGIGKKDSFLKFIISFKIYSKVKNFDTLNFEQQNAIYEDIAKDFSDAFTFLTKEKILLKFDNDIGYHFDNVKGDILISDKNFNHIRKIILKQNLLREPKIYQDELVKEWEERAIRARSRNSLSFGEKKNILRCSLSIPYEDIDELNICQFELDFLRVCHNRELLSLDILRSTYGVDSSKLPDLRFSDSLLGILLKDPTESLWKAQEDTNIGKAMGLNL